MLLLGFSPTVLYSNYHHWLWRHTSSLHEMVHLLRCWRFWFLRCIDQQNSSPRQFGSLAQMVERVLSMHEAQGSIPWSSTPFIAYSPVRYWNDLLNDRWGPRVESFQNTFTYGYSIPWMVHLHSNLHHWYGYFKFSQVRTKPKRKRWDTFQSLC
jgi:hypothetical protein